MIVMAAMAMTLGLCYGICGWCQTRGTAVVVREVWLAPLCNAVVRETRIGYITYKNQY